jgi:hypothetical protein
MRGGGATVAQLSGMGLGGGKGGGESECLLHTRGAS